MTFSSGFTPGPISQRQADLLNELMRRVVALDRLTVAAPLNIVRNAGIPVISALPTGNGDLLYEITSNNAATPPVHTGKRKTRDAANNVVDYSPAETQTQILNPLEEVRANGTLVELVAIPDKPGWFWGFAISDSIVPPDADCQACGWLRNRDALIAAGKALRVRILAGAGGGQCSCIEAQGENDADPWLALHDAMTDTWNLSRTLETCCGCASLVLNVPGTATAAADPPIAGILTVNNSCDTDSSYTYDLIYECCGDGVATLSGTGPKNCDPEEDGPFGCDNTFLVTVECVECPPDGVPCDECQELCAPAALSIVASGFTSTWADYNGTWSLADNPANNCEWSTGCGPISVTAVMTHTGNNSTTLTVTFTGAAGGTAVYLYTEPDVGMGIPANIGCFVDHTVAWQSGSDPNNPDTLVVQPVFCAPACEALCTSVDWANLSAVVSHPTGDCGCVVLTYSSNTASSTTFGLTGCDNNVQLLITCEAGRIRISISGSVAHSEAVVSFSRDPFVYVVDIAIVDTPVAPCVGTFRVTFSD